MEEVLSPNGLESGKPWHREVSSQYAYYVLVLIILCYTLEEVHRYVFAVILLDDIQVSPLGFDMLTGGFFIVVYAVFGLPLGFLADRYSRTGFLALFMVFWCLTTAMMSLCTAYWQLAVLRALQGLGLSGFTPAATSLISEYFSLRMRTTVLSMYNWGIYLGVSFILSVGSILELAIGWRLFCVTISIPGFIIASILLLTVTEPKKPSPPPVLNLDVVSPQENVQNQANQANNSDFWSSFGVTIKLFFSSPTLLLVCLGGCLRNGASYVWIYYCYNYFLSTGFSTSTLASYLSWIPIVSGIAGASIAGIIIDRFANHSVEDPVASMKLAEKKLILLVASCFLSSPLNMSILFSNSQMAFFWMALGTLVAEMWIGVSFSVVMDLIPVRLRASAVSFYMVAIWTVGGNFTLLVSILADLTTFRTAMIILFPGMIIAAGFVFLAAYLCCRCQNKRQADTQISLTVFGPSQSGRVAAA